jgi:signal transduction histidine kinase
VAFPIAVTGEAAPHLCIMIQDVTEQENARRERDEYAAILARLLDATDGAIFFVGADLRIRFANRLTESFFGISPHRIIGKPMPALLEELAGSTSDAATFLARTREMYEDLSLERDEDLDLQTPTRRHVHRKSGPVRDGAGRILGRIEVYTDQTEAVEKRQLLEAQNRELDAFASRLAHDLKTPLVSLKGFVDLLHRQHGPTLDDRGALYLDKVRSSAGILAEMVDGLRELVHASEAIADCPSLAPLPILRLVADALAPEAAERGVEVSLPPSSPEVCCDRAKLFQMFQNLLSNAIRHSDPEKAVRWVKVEIAETGPDVEIRLSDNGVGLEEEELPEIFQPFRRGRRAAGKPGMGLGLAITRRIVQVCNGRVEVRSRPGQGSTFSLFLPRGD